MERRRATKTAGQACAVGQVAYASEVKHVLVQARIKLSGRQVPQQRPPSAAAHSCSRPWALRRVECIHWGCLRVVEWCLWESALPDRGQLDCAFAAGSAAPAAVD
eukprot:6469100-Amphidinium_carterae.3